MSELDELIEEGDEAAEEAFDLSDIEEAQIGALPDGRYLCVVVDAKKDIIKEGENKGAPKIVVRLKPISPASNKPIFKHGVLKGKGAPYTKGFLKALGVDVSQPIKPRFVLNDEDGNDRYVWLTLQQRKDRAGDSNIVAVEPFDGVFPEDVEDAGADLEEMN